MVANDVGASPARVSLGRPSLRTAEPREMPPSRADAAADDEEEEVVLQARAETNNDDADYAAPRGDGTNLLSLTAESSDEDAAIGAREIPSAEDAAASAIEETSPVERGLFYSCFSTTCSYSCSCGKGEARRALCGVLFAPNASVFSLARACVFCFRLHHYVLLHLRDLLLLLRGPVFGSQRLRRQLVILHVVCGRPISVDLRRHQLLFLSRGEGPLRKIYCEENMIQRNVSFCFLSLFTPSRSGLLLSSGLNCLHCLSCGLLLPSGLRHLQCLSCGLLLPRLQFDLLDVSGRVSTALALTCLRQSALLGLWDSDCPPPAIYRYYCPSYSSTYRSCPGG